MIVKLYIMVFIKMGSKLVNGTLIIDMILIHNLNKCKIELNLTKWWWTL